ncbi:c-type cytochrome [Pelagibaculum spongiae]|nr:c-type cytochrome [Pelagibaculum spongiae]
MLPRIRTLLLLVFSTTFTATFPTNAWSADDYVLDLYSTYCVACHTAPQSGAPQAFDHSDWQQRLSNKGLNGLVNSAVSGFKNMPPVGGCGECTAEDLEDLIRYMSSAKSDQGKQS